MRAITNDELYKMNGYAVCVLFAIRDAVAQANGGAVRLKYNDVARKYKMSRHSVVYNVGKLLNGELISITDDKKIMLLVELPKDFKAG